MARRTNNVFQEIEREFEAMEERLDRVMNEIKNADWSKIDPDRIAFYGWTLERGPDGVPRWHEFGNITPGEVLPADTRKPVVSKVVDEKRGETHFTVEVPGVERDEITIEAGNGIVHVFAGSRDRAFETTIDADGVDPTKVNATYRNGVLDLTVKLVPGERHARRGVDLR